jgi:hypothetical protein
MSLDTPACAGSALAAPGPMSTDVVDLQRRREQHRVIDALARKTHGHRIVLAIPRLRRENISILSERLKEIRKRQLEAKAKTIYHLHDPDPA